MKQPLDESVIVDGTTITLGGSPYVFVRILATGTTMWLEEGTGRAALPTLHECLSKLALATQTLRDIDEACLAACGGNHPNPAPDLPRYLCLSEAGTAVIATDDPVEVIHGLHHLWHQVSEVHGGTISNLVDRIEVMRKALLEAAPQLSPEALKILTDALTPKVEVDNEG